MSLLTLKNVNSGYGPVQILKDLTLEVEEGKIVTLIGSNGAGKTTTLRTISGLIKPISGEIHFNKKRIDNLQSNQIVNCGIAHCPEGRQIWPKMTVQENLDLGAYIRRDMAEIKKDIENMFSVFPILKTRRNQLAESLSGGEQQALAIARALLLKPKLILFDEPSLGLSPILIKETLKVIENINKIEGITVLLVEQNATMALQMSDYGYVLEKGSISLEGTADQLINNDHVRKSYLGM